MSWASSLIISAVVCLFLSLADAMAVLSCLSLSSTDASSALSISVGMLVADDKGGLLLRGPGWATRPAGM